jgi:hypothetical protein
VEGAALPAHLQHVRWMMAMPSAEREALYHAELRQALAGTSAVEPIEAAFERVAGADPLTQQQYVDLKTYLADDILTDQGGPSQHGGLARSTGSSVGLPPG